MVIIIKINYLKQQWGAPDNLETVHSKSCPTNWLNAVTVISAFLESSSRQNDSNLFIILCVLVGFIQTNNPKPMTVIWFTDQVCMSYSCLFICSLYKTYGTALQKEA